MRQASVAALASAAFSFVVSGGIVLAIDKTIGFRLTEDDDVALGAGLGPAVAQGAQAAGQGIHVERAGLACRLESD